MTAHTVSGVIGGETLGAFRGPGRWSFFDARANCGTDTYDNHTRYASLRNVLDRAYQQAATGKGAERHGQALPFERQPMQTLCHLYGPGFALGQAAKKAQESQRMPRDAAVRELLGAINYLAGAVIFLEAQQ